MIACRLSRTLIPSSSLLNTKSEVPGIKIITMQGIDVVVEAGFYFAVQ
jgi:hypothetical protein